MASYDFIAGPVHINKNHWALLFINVKTQTVLYIDSKGENIDASNKVLLNWRYFCKNREQLRKIEWKTNSYNHVIQFEHDNSNCGVFVSYFFDQLLAQNMAMLKTFDIANLRMHMRNTIISSSKKKKKKLYKPVILII
jgi:Ulp1 family protease